MATVNVAKVAQTLNLSEQRVQQLVHEGMPRQARGQYDPVKCMLFYIRYLQQAIEKKSTQTLYAGSLGERDPRVRLLRADADLREMELAKQRANLMAVTDVNKILSDVVRTTTTRVMAIPQRLAPELMGETSRVMLQAKIERECKRALAELARAPVQS